MYFKKVSIIIVSLFFTFSTFPGVVLLSEVPQGVKQLINNEQLISQQNVDEYNKSNKTNFLLSILI